MKSKQTKKLPLPLKISRIIARTSLPEIGFIASFVLGRYLINADFQYISETIIPIVFFGVIATIVLYGYRLLLKSWFAARIATLPFIYGLYSYSYLPKWFGGIGTAFLPKGLETDFTTSVVTVLLLVVGCGALGYGANLLVARIKFLQNLQLHRILLFAVLFIFATQAIKTGNVLMQYRQQIAYDHQSVTFEKDPTAQVTKPDIYYFVFDRYGNNPTFSSIYNFDNSDVTDYLGSKGFVTNPDAYANYPFTMSSVSSTMAMEYHTGLSKLFGNDKAQSAFAYRNILNDPPVAQILKNNGYTYNQVSSWWDFTRVGIHADEHPSQAFRLRAFGKNFYLIDLTRDVLNKSVMKPWLKKGTTVGSTILIKYDNDLNPSQNFYAQKKAIKDIAGNTHSSPQFTFAHVLIPHTPYVFDADGSDPAYDEGQNDFGADESVKYINAVKFINTQIKDMMGYIREKSPNAVIIIQADEGPYPKKFRHALTPDNYYDPATLPLEEQKQKFGIIASYYMPGVSNETVKQNITSSVNPFRFVLKQYLGYKVDMLPVCNFSTGNKFTIYTFTNETPKLSQNPPESCNSL